MNILEDLKKIQSIQAADFEKICALLNTRSSDDEWAVSLAKVEKVAGSQNVQALLRFIDFISDNLVNARDYESRLNRITKVIQGLVEDEPEARQAWVRTQEVLKSLDGYLEGKKEERLKDKFNRLETFEITTDIRPVFNTNKDKVSKNLIVNILKIETADHSFICDFYEEDIDILIKELQLSKQKIKTLKEHYG